MSCIMILCITNAVMTPLILEWTTSLDTSSSTLFVCRGGGTVSSGIYLTVSLAMHVLISIMPTMGLEFNFKELCVHIKCI